MPGQPQKGLTLITSMWEDTNGIDLIDLNGKLIHKWRVSLNKVLPEVKKLVNPLKDWDTIILGIMPYPNGDVIFVFENAGLVRIDKCSNVIWKIAGHFHHSIQEDDDGNLWVPGKKIHLQPVDRLPFFIPPIKEELLLKISPDGNILREISILDVFIKSEMETLFFVNTDGVLTRAVKDFSHINDIEILDETMAPQFPLFNAGDIMVSMRHLNLIVIIDSVTEKIKWWMTGPFHRQHDPDFQPNGRISVFDNRSDEAEGAILGGSRILSIDPVSRKVDIVYKNNPSNYFYTEIQGVHQFLPNGNILISESLAGRVFEINPQKEVVWSYINRYDEDEVYRVTEGIRLNEEFGNFAKGEMNCP
ncbi:MAG: aryl-sulfate sulfotransferase [Nitrospinae bacterium]|nr:aryl-sulfate sulfotransferase [Nitrospinota bacterium]